jgi:6-phosphogluconolactonase
MNRVLIRKLSVLGAVLFLVAAFAGCGGTSGGSGPTTGPSGNSQSEVLYAAFVTPSGAGLGGQILPISVNANTGALTPLTGVLGPGNPVTLIADPGRRFLYGSDFNSGMVFAYSIDAATGSLTALSNSPYATPFFGNGGPLGMDPAGKFVFFVADPNGDIVTFIRNSTDGKLTLSSAAVVQDTNQPIELVVDPSGKFLYAADHSDPSGNEISVFSIDGATGGLTPVSGSPFTFQMNSEPWGMAISSTGRYLYTALSNASSVAALSVDSSTGAVAPLPNSPFSTNLIPQQLALHPSGKFLYTGNVGLGSISAFSVDAASGALAPISGSPYNSVGPVALTLDPSGKFLFFSQSFPSAQLVEWQINQASGALSPATSTPFSSSAPVALTVVLLP